VVAALVVFAVDRDAPDGKLGATATAKALPAAAGTHETYLCAEARNDGTIDSQDVDYVCEPFRTDAAGYWVGTNAGEITELQSMG
jgi:hypothetical protein